MRLGRRGHAADLVAFHAGDAVETREPFVDRDEIALEEIAHIEVAPEDFREEALGLADDGNFEVPVVFGVKILRRRIRADFAQAEPLAGEIFHEGVALRVGDHPRGLRTEHGGLEQFAVRGEAGEFVVGHGRPQKIREPRGEFVGVEFARLRSLGLHEVEEMRRRQHRGERHLHRLGERRLFRAHFFKQRQLRLNLLRLHRTPVGARHKARQHFARVRLLALHARRIEQHALMARGRPARIDRPFQLDPIHEELRARKLVAPLHPEILQHRRHVVGVGEIHARRLRGEMRPHHILLRRGFRGRDVHLRDDPRRPREMLRELQPRRAVVVHAMRLEMPQVIVHLALMPVLPRRVLRVFLVAPFFQDRPRRSHHLRALRHPARRANAQEVVALHRHLEIAEADALVPRLVMDHREAILRRIFAVVEQDVIFAALHPVAIRALRIFLRLEAPLDRLRLRALDQRAVENLPRRRVVEFDLQRRNRERLTDVVEAAGGRVFGKFIRR